MFCVKMGNNKVPVCSIYLLWNVNWKAVPAGFFKGEMKTSC